MAYVNGDDRADDRNLGSGTSTSDEVCGQLVARLEGEVEDCLPGCEALAASERRWRTLSQNLPGILLTVTPDLSIATLDGIALERLGLDAADFVGKSVLELFSRLNWDPAGIASALAGEPSVIEGEVDGRTIEVHLTPVRGADGLISEVIGCGTDVSERILAERNLRRVEYRQAQVLASVPVILYTREVGGNFDISWVSDNTEDIVGFQADKLLGGGEFWRDRIHPADRLRVLRNIGQVLEHGRFEHDFRWRCADDCFHWFRGEGVLIRDADGNPAEVAGMWLDISDRKEVEEARDQLASIMEATTDLVAITDGQGRGRYLNPAGRLLLGYRPDEPLGEEAILGMEPARGGAIAARFKAAAQDGTWRGEDVWTLQGGRELPVSQVVIAHRATDGIADFFSMVVRDMTEQKALEAQLRQAQKMEAIGRLAGGVAHDFNNLLTVLMISSGRLLDHLGPAEQAYRHAREIRRATERAAALTTQLLAFSRKQHLEPSVLDLRAVVEGMLGMLESLLGEGIVLSTCLDAEVPPIEADRGQIEQVIMNVAVNACDAMPAGGNLIIEIALAALDESYTSAHPGSDPGEYVVLAITDTGMGMDAEIQSKIFEPFFTTKAPGMGTGLGLATSYGIVKQSGGSIGVYSEPGRGSTFKIYLPARRGGTIAGEPPEADSDSLAGAGTVLLVEDDEMVRGLIHDQLIGLGYDVVEARHGKEALALYGSGDLSIDLLLTDVVMPAMGGPELSRELTVAHPDLRTLFMSGYTANSISHHGLVATGASFIHKPFTAEVLSRAVREALAAAPAAQGS